LAALEPSIFTGNDDEANADEANILYLCRLLKVQKGTLLPHVTHEIEPTVEAFSSAFCQHYAAIGGLVGPKTMANMELGLWVKGEGGKTITYTEDTKEEKTSVDFGQCDAVNIVNPLDPLTEVECVTGGRTLKTEALWKDFFQAEGIKFPTLEVEWQGALFGAKKPMSTPTKKRKTPSRSPPSSGGTDPNAFASKQSVMVQDALRKKMKKEPAAGTPGSGSASSQK
jgi:hypothetical protein